MEERYHIGNFSRLDYQQAKVDFNADSAQYMKQHALGAGLGVWGAVNLLEGYGSDNPGANAHVP